MSTAIKRPGLVVGVDGSSASRAAIDWAARDAAMREIPLTLVHVVPVLGGTWPTTPLPAGFGEWQQQQGRQFINDAVGLVRDATGPFGTPEVKTEIYYSATVPTLVDLSKGAEMIVVGRRGHDGIDNLLGSVSAGVVQHAHCPVAVIHEPLLPHSASAPVLLGIDGSPVSELATVVAFEEASRRQVDLVALHAWSDARVLDFPGLDWSTMEASAGEVLAERLAGWQSRYPDVTIHRHLVRDRPAHQIIEKSEAAQLVVVGSHGRGGFAGMVLGSVSAAVIQSARTPVIVAREA